MIVYNGRGKPVRLGDTVGRGGEAIIYLLADRPRWLAKIYEPEPRPNYISKLSWMVDHPPGNPTGALNHASLAWPDGLLFDPQGRLKGYQMPYIEHGLALLEVFNPRRRAEVLPQFDRRYLYRTARNLSAALSALHHSGYVAGDINESNVLVTPQALVTLIDTDSFQVREEGNRVQILYPCPVGKPEYTPPELQGKSLVEIAREPDHDAFGLAVLIFQLLMEGSHPFRAQWLGSGEPPPLEKRIGHGAYPYIEIAGQMVAPPKTAPPIESLHPWLVELFRRCFVDGHKAPRWRPGPDLWARAIAEAEKSLVCCAEGHFYGSHLDGCIYCARPKKRISERPASSQPAGAQNRARWARFQPASGVRSAPAAGAGGARTFHPRPSGTAAAGRSRVGAAGVAPQSGIRGSGVAFSVQRRVLGSLLARLSGWPGIVATAVAPAGYGSRGGGSLGVPQSWQRIQPGMMSAWLRQWLSRSFIFGGGYGALAGAALASMIALLNWSAGSPLNWELLLAGAGLAGGLIRGWQPGCRLANLLDRYVGWKRFWQGVGLLIGAGVGAAFGLVFAWSIIPVIFGLILGAKSGLYLGGQFWKVGKPIGWERILGTLGAFGAAGLGWGAAKIAGAGGFDYLGVQLAAGLLPFSGDGLPGSALIWFLGGGFSGAVFGALAGLLVDLLGRLMRLTN